MNKTHIKWIARFIGGIALVFFGMFIIGEGVPNWNEIEDPQLKSMLMLLVFAAAGYVFAWFREKEGGIILSLSGFLLGMNMFYHGGAKDTIAALIFSLPFLIPGIMFWILGNKRKNKH